MEFYYIIDFLVFQILIFFYARYLFKGKITPGAISAFGAVILMEIICIYNLITKQATSWIIFNYLLEFFNLLKK